MSLQPPVAFAVAKKNRVALPEIDVRGATAAKKLSRVLPSVSERTERVPTFNSAL